MTIISLPYNKILWLVWILISLQSYAQTYTLPDTSLRNKLMTSYPGVMTGNQLNISAAGSMTGVLNLSNASISNADGVQYFTNISILNLNNNELITLPNIDGLTQLIGIYIAYNKLESVPSISNFTSLLDFQVQYNNLTSLPSFTNNTNLLYIYCQNNKITSLPDISTLTKLRVLDIGENNFGSLPDFSPLTDLEQLHVHLTGIDTIIGLSSLNKLQRLYAWGNRIRDLSDLNGNTTLTLFQVFNNDLKALPILSNKPSLATVSLINNYLSFEDLLPLTSNSNFNVYSYNPQKKFSLTSYTVREKDNVSFALAIDPSITTNQYTWYKNGTILTTNQTGILSISAAEFSDSGNYTVQVTNPGFTGLTILSDTARLSVKTCMEINHMDAELLSENCIEGTTLQLSNLTLGGGLAPFSYGIVKPGKTDTLFVTGPQFQSLSPGIYTVTIKDSRMCKATQSLSIRKPGGCQALISPNGDGVSDSYYIEEPGIARIYDISRTLIKELTTPAEWDGRKSDHGIADDGYYAIVINDKKVIHITLVK